MNDKKSISMSFSAFKAMLLTKGDLLDQQDGGVILTIDGDAPGMEGHLARSFKAKYSEAWSHLDEQLVYPTDLGFVQMRPLQDHHLPFSHALIASLLYHRGVVEKQDRIHLVENVLSTALSLGQRVKLPIIHTAILTGGWRLTLEEALLAMLDVLKTMSRHPLYLPVLNICVLDDAEFELANKTITDFIKMR